MALLGKRIRITGVTLKGKNRIREHGNDWVVLAETDHVLFAPGAVAQWLFVAPVGRGHNDKASRWVRANGDTDFLVSAVDD